MASLIALVLVGVLTATIALIANPGTPQRQASPSAHGPIAGRSNGAPAHSAAPAPSPQQPTKSSPPPPAAVTCGGRQAAIAPVRTSGRR